MIAPSLLIPRIVIILEGSDIYKLEPELCIENMHMHACSVQRTVSL